MQNTNLSQATNGTVENTRPQSGRRAAPPVDIFENADGFLILADLPGVEPEGLTVEYNPPELHVSARVNGSDALVYERRFELGSGIDPAAINAELTQGVLRIELKKSAALRPRRIEVRAS
jgi:HSP20 family protein